MISHYFLDCFSPICSIILSTSESIFLVNPEGALSVTASTTVSNSRSLLFINVVRVIVTATTELLQGTECPSTNRLYDDDD